MAEPLEAIALKMAQALRDPKDKTLWLAVGDRVAKHKSGPVLAVVRNTKTGTLVVAVNADVPGRLATVLERSIQAQGNRIAAGEVVVIRTEPTAAAGGHAEVQALNHAILLYQKRLGNGRQLTEQELKVFELHNVWLKGSRADTVAPRCEHCARITRGVRVTQSLFVAEGGVVGEIVDGNRVSNKGGVNADGTDVPRGRVTPAGGGRGRAVPTGKVISGEIPAKPRGSVTTAGPGGQQVKVGNGVVVSGTVHAPQNKLGGNGWVGAKASVSVTMGVGKPGVKAWAGPSRIRVGAVALGRGVIRAGVAGVFQFALGWLKGEVDKWQLEKEMEELDVVAESKVREQKLLIAAAQSTGKKVYANITFDVRQDHWIDKDQGFVVESDGMINVHLLAVSISHTPVNERSGLGVDESQQSVGLTQYFHLYTIPLEVSLPPAEVEQGTRLFRELKDLEHALDDPNLSAQARTHFWMQKTMLEGKIWRWVESG